MSAADHDWKNRRGSVFVAVLSLSAVGDAFAQSAIRDLPDYHLPGDTLTITIALSVPPATIAVGLEDKPPAGWAVGIISHGGSLDVQNGKVKWGPFFGGSIPPAVTYDVSPPTGGGGRACFAGTATFDLGEQPIGGDVCVAFNVPAVSTWGLLTSALALATLGSVMLRRRFAATGTSPA
jgi:hypothetical protein